MKILSRVGSSVILEAKDGSVWLTRRKKKKKDSRRRRLFKGTVRYIPIKQLS